LAAAKMSLYNTLGFPLMPMVPTNTNSDALWVAMSIFFPLTGCKASWVVREQEASTTRVHAKAARVDRILVIFRKITFQQGKSDSLFLYSGSYSY
jgi:hypothetical protein